MIRILKQGHADEDNSGKNMSQALCSKQRLAAANVIDQAQK